MKAVEDYIKEHPTASAAEIVAAMGSRGIEIKESTVYNVRTGMRKSGLVGAGNNSPAATAEAPARGKRKGKRKHGAKANAIRKAIEELGEDFRNRDVIQRVKRKGFTVSAAQVAAVRKRMDLAPAAEPAAAARPAKKDKELTWEAVKAAKKLAEELGGIAAAKRALDALAETQVQ
jgi:hypothetical protein